MSVLFNPWIFAWWCVIFILVGWLFFNDNRPEFKENIFLRQAFLVTCIPLYEECFLEHKSSVQT
jgi:hypothetical protein